MVTHRVECPPRDKAASQPATRRLVKVLGLVVAASGVEHGLGEALQGNRELAGPMIRSWPDSRFFRIENGEPAFTLLPHPVAAGVLTLMVAVGLAVRSWYIDRGAHPRRDLLALSALLFLVGGGFGPPLIGVALSIPAGWVRRRPVHRTTGWCRGLGAASGWLLAAAVAGWLALVPGCRSSTSPSAPATPGYYSSSWPPWPCRPWPRSPPGRGMRSRNHNRTPSPTSRQ